MNHRYSTNRPWRNIRTSVATIAVLAFLAIGTRGAFATTVAPSANNSMGTGDTRDIVSLVVADD